MVSLQQNIFPWFEYEPTMNPFYPALVTNTNYSSYHDLPKQTFEPDPMMDEWIDIDFVKVYTRYIKAFTKKNRYTLFIPIHSTLFKSILDFPYGHSSQEQWTRVDIQNELENTLCRHMISYRIDPSSLHNQDVRLETVLGDHMEIDSRGIIDKDPTNRITHYIVYPHATLYFITHERSDKFYK